jgi:hypothetical protein
MRGMDGSAVSATVEATASKPAADGRQATSLKPGNPGRAATARAHDEAPSGGAE